MSNSVGTIIITVTRTDEGSAINRVVKNISSMELLSLGELMKVEALEELREKTTSNENISIQKEMD